MPSLGYVARYAYRMGVRDELLKTIRKAGISDRQLSMIATGSTDTVRNIRRGANPRADTLEALCNAIGLELHIGPPREQDDVATQASEPPPADAGVPVAEATLDPAGFASDFKEAVRDEVANALRAETQAMRRAIRKEIREDLAAFPRQLPTVANDLEDAGALAVTTVEDGATDVPATRAVQMIEMEAAAGGGGYNLDDAPAKGPVWFRRDWIDSHGMDPTQAVIISVRGDSMEPTLPAGCKILLDRHRRRRHVGHIYVITTAEGLIVKRLGRGEDGSWLLVSDSDSPDWPDVSWPDDAVVDGEVKWMARELP